MHNIFVPWVQHQVVFLVFPVHKIKGVLNNGQIYREPQEPWFREGTMCGSRHLHSTKPPRP